MEIYLLLGVLLFAVVLFIIEKYSIDLVAFTVLSLLILFGLVSPQEAIAGFSSPATVTVAAMFVLSASLERTGCLLWAGKILLKIGNRPLWLLFAIMMVVGVILFASLNILPIVLSSIIGCVLVLLTGCLRIDDVYEVINWQVIFLLAGMIPLGIAMETTGTASWIVNLVLENLDVWGPQVTLAVLYLITTLLTEAMSNNASAILLAPIAISIANNLGVDPKPFVIAVTFAASTSFLTPVGYQTNAMVYSPGGYTYTDFVKVGLPLNFIFLLISTFLIPLIWPF